MLLKDVKVGEVYLVARYGSASAPRTRRRWHLDDQKVAYEALEFIGIELDEEDAGVVDVANYRIKHWEDQRG